MNRLAQLSIAFSTATALTLSAQTFFLDPQSSTLTLSGNVAGAPITEQGPGSLLTRFQGRFDVVLTASSIQFLPTSFVDAQLNGEWQPAERGNPGFAPADFAGQSSLGFTIVQAAFRDFMMSLQSEPISLLEGSFDASEILFALTSEESRFDYNAGFLGQGTTYLTGRETSSTLTNASLVVSGQQQIIRIPFSASVRFSAASANDSELIFNGEFLAQRHLNTSPSIREIRLQQEKVIILVEGATAESQLQTSTDLQDWILQSATSTALPGGLVQFEFTRTHPAAFFKVRF